MSSIINNNPLYKKGIFFVEPEKMIIKTDENNKEVRIWAIPDEPV